MHPPIDSCIYQSTHPPIHTHTPIPPYKLDQVCDGSNNLSAPGWKNINKKIPLYCPCSCSFISLFISPTRTSFLSRAQRKLRLFSANHRPGYWRNLPSDSSSTVWAYSEQETENGPRRTPRQQFPPIQRLLICTKTSCLRVWTAFSSDRIST